MKTILSRDILDKINRDFDDSEEADLALSVLADFVEENQDLSADRIIRCIVFVADGDLDLLDKAIKLAKIDYRDLIVWAEYDEHRERVRDLSVPFSG